MQVTHVCCAFGGTGLAPEDYCAVALCFDVTTTRAIRNLRMTQFVVGDVASGCGPIELREWRPGLDRHHNEITLPFSGAIASGATLRLRGVLELTPIPPGVALLHLPYVATLVADDEFEELRGVLDDPWATA